MQEIPAPRYEFSEGVRAQLNQIRGLGDARFWERLTLRDRQSDLFLSAEVLVVMLRRYLARGDVDAAQRIAEELLERWTVYIRQITWRWFSDSESDREDMVQEVHTRLWRSLITPGQRFWEVNFIHALRCLCIDVGSAMRPNPPHPLPALAEEREDSTPIIAQVLQAELQEWIDRAIPRLPLNQIIAMYLRYVAELPITRDDPAITTVTTVMCVSDRTVRNYLRDGIETLRQLSEKEKVRG